MPARSAAGTTASRNPAAAAVAGMNGSARVSARWNAAGVSRYRRISIAVCGIVMPMATSLAVNLNGPSAPTR